MNDADGGKINIEKFLFRLHGPPNQGALSKQHITCTAGFIAQYFVTHTIILLMREHDSIPQGLTDDSDNAFRGNMVAIDVRSPGEYEKGHIPGAINIPLFSNDERAVVGTDFNQRGRYTAIKTGLGVIGPKLQHIVRGVEHAGVVEGGAVLVYCWRGGMRSGSVAWLLRLCGFQVKVSPLRMLRVLGVPLRVLGVNGMSLDGFLM